MVKRTEDDGRVYGRRSVLRYGGAALCGLGVVTTGVAAGGSPNREEVDVTGRKLDVPCLGETVRITKGTWVVIENSRSS